MSVLDKKSLNVELSWRRKGKMGLKTLWLGFINKIPVLGKGFLISSQLLLFHQHLLDCVLGFFAHCFFVRLFV